MAALIDMVFDAIYNESGINGTDLNLTDASNDSEISPVMYYELPYQIVSTILSSIWFLSGFFGNMLVVLVVTRRANMRTPTNCYLVSLAFADILVLIFATGNSIAESVIVIDQWIWSAPMCPIVVFFQYLGINTSALSITAFTIERFIAICYPMRAQTICTVSRANKIIISLWVFSVLYNSPWLYLAHTAPLVVRDNDTNGTTFFLEKCMFRLSMSQYAAYYMADLIVFYVIPLLLSIGIYIRIGRVLFASGHVKNSTEEKTLQRHNKQANSSRSQVVKMLVVVVVSFALLWMPYRCIVVYNTFSTHVFMNIWYFLFCKQCLYINSAINPILYNAMSEKFQKAFREQLRCESRTSSQLDYSASTALSPLNAKDRRSFREHGPNRAKRSEGDEEF